MEDESFEGGMSNARDGRGRYSREDMSYRGNSYARGRGRNARRDSLGRYSSRGGYSMANEEYVEQLEEMMQEVPESAQRHIQKAIQEMQNM